MDDELRKVLGDLSRQFERAMDLKNIEIAIERLNGHWDSELGPNGNTTRNINQLQHAVFGNGRDGLDTEVDRLKLAEVERAKMREDERRRLDGRNRLIWGAIISLASVMTAALLSRWFGG